MEVTEEDVSKISRKILEKLNTDRYKFRSVGWGCSLEEVNNILYTLQSDNLIDFELDRTGKPDNGTVELTIKGRELF